MYLSAGAEATKDKFFENGIEGLGKSFNGKICFAIRCHFQADWLLAGRDFNQLLAKGTA
jgi:hypothetical protein